MTLLAEVSAVAGTFDLEARVEVRAGEVLALVGPNGAGKTTLLRALAGLHPLTSGFVEIGGRRVEDEAVDRRRTGYVFQEHRLFPHLSALDNVAFGARARGLPDPAGRARHWLRRVGMEEAAGLHPAALSGGQSQRVALARALASDPEVLLLDEPLAALDATTRVGVRRELRRHLEGFAGAAVLVTHDPVDAAALAGSVAVMEAGRIVQTGTLTEITGRPRTLFAADLAGVNVWRGTARPGGVIETGGALLHAGMSPEGEVFAMLHPRAVSLHRRRPEGSPRNVWRGRVAAVEAAADRVRVRVDGDLPVVAEITPAALAEMRLTGGEEAWVSFKASEVTVYPA